MIKNAELVLCNFFTTLPFKVRKSLQTPSRARKQRRTETKIAKAPFLTSFHGRIDKGGIQCYTVNIMS